MLIKIVMLQNNRSFNPISSNHMRCKCIHSFICEYAYTLFYCSQSCNCITTEHRLIGIVHLYHINSTCFQSLFLIHIISDSNLYSCLAFLLLINRDIPPFSTLQYSRNVWQYGSMKVCKHQCMNVWMYECVNV